MTDLAFWTIVGGALEMILKTASIGFVFGLGFWAAHAAVERLTR